MQSQTKKLKQCYSRLRSKAASQHVNSIFLSRVVLYWQREIKWFANWAGYSIFILYKPDTTNVYH